MTMADLVNHVRVKTGRVVAICQCCGNRSRPIKANDQGEPDLWRMGRGWSEAPFPADSKHADGSVGSRYTCPTCNERLSRGETLQRRLGGQIRDAEGGRS